MIKPRWELRTTYRPKWAWKKKPQPAVPVGRIVTAKMPKKRFYGETACAISDAMPERAQHALLADSRR